MVNELPPQVRPTDTSAPWWKLRAGWIYESITSGELRNHDAKDDVRYCVCLETIGELALPDGRLVAADPYIMESEPEPFMQRIQADRAQVIAARALVGPDHERVAALLLRIGSQAIEDWDMAVTGGQDPTTLEEEGFFGYGVDAGTGLFGSPEAAKVAGRVLMADAGMLEDPISEALLADGVGTRSAVVVAPEEGATPIAACSSGWGDGFYPTWLGLDGDGQVVVVVTDFLLTGDPYAAPLPAEGKEAQAPQASKTSWLRRWFKS